MIKYFYDGLGIKKIECTRETEKCVWVKVPSGERRDKKLSRYGVYFDTWSEVHSYLIGRVKSNIEYAERDLQEKREHLKKVEALTREAF